MSLLEQIIWIMQGRDLTKEAREILALIRAEIAKSRLTYEEHNKIVDKALREHYRETMERERVPSDYLRRLIFTEGGESNAVADATAQAQLDKVLALFEE